MKFSESYAPYGLVVAGFLSSIGFANAALLAYEPFTNAPGTAIIGSADGFGFSGAWQNYQSSAGVATNTSGGLSYTDASGKQLVTAGGAGFFQGLTSANTSMQPIRLFNFSRGTNGADDTTTWIGFLAARQGPAVAGANPFPRGANVDHDFNTGDLQKLAVGNSTGAGINSVGLIPLGNAGNLKSSTVLFSQTNFIVVRVDHKPGAPDDAYLFVNPPLDAEPDLSQANTNTLGGFDFSFNRLRVFAGGNNSGAGQPYAELLIDEYRVGTTFADVAPFVSDQPSATNALVITNAALLPEGFALSGTGGSNSAAYFVLAGSDITSPGSWSPVATNSFDANGNFSSTNPLADGAEQKFFRLVIADSIPVSPSIIGEPTNCTVNLGQSAVFDVLASGTAPLRYQWFFNTNSALPDATNATLTIVNSQFTDAGAYFVIVTNIAGSATSEVAFLTVTNPPAKPEITNEPVSQTVIAGNDATFTVGVSGTLPLSYQWYFNTDTPLADATNFSLTITNAQTNDAGGYFVIVTNAHGAATSIVATLTVDPPLVPGAFYVSVTNGNDSNSGTLESPFKTISRGLTAIGTNGIMYLRAGVYAQPSKLNLNRIGTANYIRIWAYPGETPIINSAGNSSDGIGISGRRYHLKGLEQLYAGHNGINISGHSNIVENCIVHSNGNTGIHITGGQGNGNFPSYNLVLNCDSFLNYDPPIGGNADGFSAKWDLGPGNVFRGCRAWRNSDDGWDLWMGTSAVVMDDCWAFYNGTNYWANPQFNGNGNGFKLGGNYIGAPHRLIRSLAFKNEVNGIDQNNNITGQTLDNNTSWGNRLRNYSMAHGTNTTPHIVRNNLSFGGGSGDTFTSGTLFTNNSWQVISPAPNAGDVLSLDDSLATGPRQPDGSLPVLPFLRPVPAGRLIDKGVNIGEPFAGAAPDIGAFESVP